MGRIDDVINVSGHRIGTAEVESALVSHPKVAEAAVVGYPHDIKGQGIYAYVTLKSGVEPADDLHERTGRAMSARRSARSLRPDKIQLADGLPKTRCGKIMRRILRKIAEATSRGPGRYLDPGRSRRGRRPQARGPVAKRKTAQAHFRKGGRKAALPRSCVRRGGADSAPPRLTSSPFRPSLGDVAPAWRGYCLRSVRRQTHL